MMKPERLRNISIRTELSVITCMVIIAVFATVTLTLGYIIQKVMRERIRSDLVSRTENMKSLIDVFDAIASSSASKISGVFLLMVTGEVSVDNSRTVKIGDYDVPVLKIGGKVINLNFEQVDRFAEVTEGSVATIFVRKGDDFIRVSTSLKKEDGTRAIGTVLDHQHPGYQKVLKGDSYIGRAALFGKNYMTKYVPIKDQKGTVIGIYFTGFDITDSIKKLREILMSVKIGDTGYFFIIDTSGQAIIHPTLAGKNVYELKDAKGKEIFKEALAKKEGVIEYFWNDGGKVRKKTMAFMQYPAWNWGIAATVYDEEIEKEMKVVEYGLVIAGIIGSFILSFIVFIVVSWKLKPIRTLAERVNEMAKGDLSITIEHGKKDEIGILAQSLQDMTSSFNDAIHRIRTSSDNVMKIVEQLRENAHGTSNSAVKQAGQAAQIATAAEEMSQTIGDIAKNASTASEASSEANDVANAGKEIADNAVSTMNRVYESTSELSGMIEKLNARVLEIGGIVTVIEDIADQTNLLALNAAIEAARAGEQGRGFAVVADEVRKLAERTIKATGEISNKIKAVQTESEMTTHSMDTATKQVSQAAGFIANVGTTLGSIVDQVNKVSDKITQIATAVDEQSAATEEVARNVDTSSEIAKEIETMANDVMQEIDSLIRVSDELRAAIAGFKVRKV